MLKRLDYRIKEWEPSFRRYVKSLLKNKNVIVTGDFNVAPNETDLFNPKANINNAGFTLAEREEFRKLLKIGFIDCFRLLYPEKVEYTYFSARGLKCREMNKGWRIDHFLINKDLEKNLLDCLILSNYKGSDHCPIMLKLNI
jgi:exodeoxyribonuclease-3